MKTYIVVASINKLENLAEIKENFTGRDKFKIIVIDEGNKTVRKSNESILQGIESDFYGPKERKRWFRKKFESDAESFFNVIPKKCHAETSFGFLVALDEKADAIIELDDDVYPVQGFDLVSDHLDNLFNNSGKILSSDTQWYNTLENLELENADNLLYPRGHPYSQKSRKSEYQLIEERANSCVLNMGLWSGVPDLDSVSILYHSGLNGRGPIRSSNLIEDKTIVEEGTYFSLCSMNTEKKKKIIPAFYQLYMNYDGIDRFDDIWSGIFLKKIADHLGDKISLGKPLVLHEKRPRDTFKDLRSELEGIAINEVLWKVVDSIDLSEEDYSSCYRELADKLEERLDSFKNSLHRNFIEMQTNKMRLWVEVVNKLS